LDVDGITITGTHASIVEAMQAVNASKKSMNAIATSWGTSNGTAGPDKGKYFYTGKLTYANGFVEEYYLK
jgi:hypothetical protein